MVYRKLVNPQGQKGQPQSHARVMRKSTPKGQVKGRLSASPESFRGVPGCRKYK